MAAHPHRGQQQAVQLALTSKVAELTGHPAATVHRLLALRPGGDPTFDRDTPLDADLVVIATKPRCWT